MGKIQVSKKFNDGTLLVLEGADPAEFGTILLAMLSPESTEAIMESFENLAPVSMGQAVANVQQGFPGAQADPVNYAPRADAGAPPGPQQLCPTHGQPGVYRPAGISKAGRPYSAFYNCPVTGESFTYMGKPKSSCPDRK